MEALFTSVLGGVALEAVAAASVAVTAVAVVAGRRCVTKRRRDDEQLLTQEPLAAAHKKARVVEPTPVVTDKHGVVQETVVALLLRHARGKLRNKIVYTFLDDQGKETINYTFADVDNAARRIAATLQRDANVQKGDRVMLCFPPGLDFAMAFWGCLYAGAVGIPVYPPYPGTLAKDLPKFNRMVEDSGAKVILTNRTYHLASKMATVKGFFSTGAAKQAATTWPENVQWITTDTVAESRASQYDETFALQLNMDDLAFFQYSSGSTSAPKAVMISHRNLKSQLKTWESIEPTDTLVSWLPSYHDMGLVGFIITPCMFGARCVSMSPISFIKDPPLWMRVVSQYKATHVCAPNFGFALVARKTSDAQASQMDLSTLKQTICAAEPIRVESLDAFTSKFGKRSGFDAKTFNCGYGLAEVTLVCTGQNPSKRKLPSVLRVSKAALEKQKKAVLIKETQNQNQKTDQVVTLVGCGMAMPTFTVAVVDVDTYKKLKEGMVGEVWLQGPSVATGYWNREEYTTEMFGALLAGEKLNTARDNTWLRTGDMGFLNNGELFVTGRLKDLIIIRGRNVVPQDVEASVESAHDHVRPGCVAAFSIEKNSEEALVVVAEIKNGSAKEICAEICREISKIVLSEHQLRCEAIVLLRQKTIPKTTSGKIQRSAAKQKFMDSVFSKPLYEFVAKDKPASSAATKAVAKVVTEETTGEETTTETEQKQQGPVKTQEEILAWMLARVAQELAVEEEEEEPTAEPTETTVTSASPKPKESKEPKEPVTPPTIDPATPWAEYGLDSVAIVGLSSELGEFLGCVVPPSAFFQYDSPQKLVNAPGLATGELESTMEQDHGAAGAGSSSSSSALQPATSIDEIDADCFEIAKLPEVTNLFSQMKEFEDAGLKVPFLETLTDETRKMVNFNTYNYLGNACNPLVAQAATEAIATYGTTMSSSPIVGQTQIAVDLENALSTFFQAESAVLFVGGWVTNVTTIDALVGKGDLILCDALNHDSCVTGQRLSGATILPFPHNDTQALERMLRSIRLKYRRVLIVIEGVYSMDGDIPNLKEMVRIKQQYKCLLFLDEAHSFGTMGHTGRGLCEHAGVDPRDVDVRMGTMSKALGSVGGFILGSVALTKYLKHCAGGFVFSVGLSPAHCGAALQSVELMTQDNSRTLALQTQSSYFYDLCKQAKVQVGATTFRGAPVVVVIIGSTIATALASQFLAQKAKVNVKPIVYPAVEEGKCRLRFFISSLHTNAQMEHAVEMLALYLKDPQAAVASLTTSGAAPVAAVVAPGSEQLQPQTETKQTKKKKKQESTPTKARVVAATQTNGTPASKKEVAVAAATPSASATSSATPSPAPKINNSKKAKQAKRKAAAAAAAAAALAASNGTAKN